MGCWFACSGMMRSMYIPEAQQASIMNVYRVPLNVLVVVGTKMEELAPADVVFCTIASWFGICCLLQIALTLTAKGKGKGGKGE